MKREIFDNNVRFLLLRLTKYFRKGTLIKENDYLIAFQFRLENLCRDFVPFILSQRLGSSLFFLIFANLLLPVEFCLRFAASDNEILNREIFTRTWYLHEKLIFSMTYKIKSVINNKKFTNSKYPEEAIWFLVEISDQALLKMVKSHLWLIRAAQLLHMFLRNRFRLDQSSRSVVVLIVAFRFTKHLKQIKFEIKSSIKIEMTISNRKKTVFDNEKKLQKYNLLQKWSWDHLKNNNSFK